MLAALARRRPVVHIASHFSFFRPGDDARSFLLLGDGSVMTLAEMKSQMSCGVETADVVGLQHGGATAGRGPARDRCFCRVGAAAGCEGGDGDLMAVGGRQCAMADAGLSQAAGSGIVKAEAFRAQLGLLRGSARVSASKKERKAESPSVVIIPTDGQRAESKTRAEHHARRGEEGAAMKKRTRPEETF